MNAQTITKVLRETQFLVTPEVKAVLALAKKRRERYRIIEDFRGPIDGQAYSLDGKWRYLPLCEEDKEIIPKAAFVRHAAVEKECCRVVQVLIGHEIPEFVPPKPEVVASMPPAASTRAKPEIDWGNVAEVAAKGFAVGMMGIAMISLYALLGAVQVIDPAYCVVLDDGAGSVVEILTWNLEGLHEKNSL